MPFEPHFETSKDVLSEQTKYRFAEIELNYALHNNLTKLFTTTERAIDQLYFLLVPNEQSSQEKHSRWREILTSPTFIKPLKAELVYYFTQHGASYTFVRQRTGISPNTMQKLRTKHQLETPSFYAVCSFWTPEMLNRWDDVKHILNIFLEPLVHFPKEVQKTYLNRK